MPAVIFITRIPTHYNDGTPVPPAVWRAITAEVNVLFSGWTLEEAAEGAWTDEDGKVYSERSRRLEVACQRGDYPAARELVLTIGRRLGQKAMYFEVRYFDGVEIITVPSAKGRKPTR